MNSTCSKKGSSEQASPKKGEVPSTGPTSSSRRFDACILLGTDTKGIVRSVNHFAETFFGKCRADILGNTFAEIALPDNFTPERPKRRFIDHFLHTPDKNDFAEFETRHVSGCPRMVAWSRSAVRDSEEALVEMVCLGIDVETGIADPIEISPSDATGKNESDSDYSLLEKYIANSKVWAWEVNADYMFRYVSPGVEKLMGYSPGELLGVGMDFILPRSAYDRFRAAIDGAVKKGKRHFNFVDQARCKNGELLWSETAGTIFFNDNNQFSEARGLSRDMSKEVAAKEELFAREQEIRYLYDNTQVALMMLDENGVLLNINQTGAKMHGREQEEMIGRKFVEFIDESEQSVALDSFMETYRKARGKKSNFIDIQPYTVRMETPIGIRCIRLVPKAIKVMEKDQMAGLLLTALDITEGHMLQEELVRHKLKLQKLVDERTEEIRTLQEEILRDERLTTLGRLTSTVSHEIRNPLGTINSSLYIINERLKGKDFGIGRSIDRGFRAIRRCDGIIEEMLDFTRTKGLEKRTIEISSWLEKLIDEMKLPENISIVKLIDPGLSAPVDAVRLHRCISNVLDNSVAALNGDQEGIIRVSARMDRGRLEISIRDNGPGVKKKLQKRVFDPLYSTKQNGVGMGLPVCKQVMELHGGSISLRSNKNRGAAVILRLPVPRQT